MRVRVKVRVKLGLRLGLVKQNNQNKTSTVYQRLCYSFGEDDVLSRLGLW